MVCALPHKRRGGSVSESTNRASSYTDYDMFRQGVTEHMQRVDSKFRGVLFICTGNICRSPMAAGLALKYGPSEWSRIVRSAGISAMDGQEAHPLALEQLDKREVDLSSHRARTVTPNLLTAFDLILTMEMAHARWIETRMPSVQSRVHLLGRWRGLEIVDPVDGGRADFELAAEQIETCLSDWSRNAWQLSDSGFVSSSERQIARGY